MRPKRLLVGAVALYLLVFPLHLFAQDRVISGKVTDSRTGTPVAGASVTPKNSTDGTTTGTDGAFTLRVSPQVRTIVISFIGYADQDVDVTSNTTVNVALSESALDLNEVVVIGYGTARKKDLTGSVAQVSSKDFQKGIITTPEQLIAGKVAGVQISSNGGQPGVGSRIRIRGGTSLNASNDPLIVIDGVAVDNGGILGAPNPLSLINPNDIESFNILKDASAAAIYGSRAANGVIIITTKKGMGGKLRVNFSSLNSISARTGEIDVLTGDQLRDLVTARGSQGEIDDLGDANTDWQDQIYRSAFATDNNISLSGGIKKLPYRLSIGYLNQDGILKRSNLKRTSLGLSLTPKFLDDHLGVTTNVKYVFSKNFFANQGAIGAAVDFDPTKPVHSGKNEFDGYYEWLSSPGTLNGLAPKNPLGLINEKEDESDVNRLIGNIQLDYKFHFFPDLRANLNLGLDKSHSEGDVFVDAAAAQDFARGGRINHYEHDKENKLLEFYFNYAKDISSIKSRVDVIAGYTWQDWITKTPSFDDLRADESVFKAAGIPGETQNTLVSFYGRLNYSLMNRYLLTATMRRDGSSRFNKDNRWGNFPSVAVAWNMTEEPFMQPVTWVSNLKLRVGWGITGQQDIGRDYGYQPNIFYGDSAARYQFGGQYFVVARPQAYDANLKWEETESVNIGLDLGFANNRLNFTIDYYDRVTKDLLAIVPAPAGTNFSNEILTNVGRIKNRGFEFSVNTNPVSNKNFSLELGYNITWIIQNEITRLQLVEDPQYLGADVGSVGINGFIQKHTVGERPHAFFLYRQVYDENGSPIEGLFEDRDGNGLINEFDKYWVKNPEPNVFMGFSASASYKQFGAGFVLRSNLGNYIYNNVKAGSGILQNVLTGQNYLNNAHVDVLRSGFYSRRTWSDYYLDNGSFLRMDNLYVNYNFGSVLAGKANLRVTANVQNVFVITKYDGLDPEVNGGIDGNVYPRPRIYALGINLDF
jgi:TonB-dependent starch-binding outer membrane protein SusC